MNANIDSTAILKKNEPSFKGYTSAKSSYGEDLYKFNYPHDSKKYDCYVELYKLKGGSDFKAGEPLYNDEDQIARYQIGKNGLNVNLKSNGISEGKPFAYRYILKSKDGSDVMNISEAGIAFHDSNRNGEKFNLALNSAPLARGGSMIHVFPDSFNPGYYYDKNGSIAENHGAKASAQHAVRTFSNKLGGTLAGIQQKLPDLYEQGYTRVLSTPIFTDDSRSAHSYWIKNAMQMSSQFGNVDNYASFVKDLFKYNMNLISDGAFVNEGLEGVHLKDVIKWGDKSPYYNWFRTTHLEQGPLALGVFPKNRENIRHRLVNAPFTYTQNPQTGEIKQDKNPNYKPNRPTYLQIFDSSLTEELNQKDSETIVENYDLLNDSNPLKMNTHNDTVINYVFPIKFENYEKNLNEVIEFNKKSSPENKILLNSYLGTRVLSQTDLAFLDDKLDTRIENWDANTDIAKLVYTTSYSDINKLEDISGVEKEKYKETIKQSNQQVQDYAIAAGKFWTKKTHDILFYDIAQKIGKVDAKNENEVYNKLLKTFPKNKLSEKISPEMIKNLLNDEYFLTKPSPAVSVDDILLVGSRNLPLDSIEFGDDLTAVLGYPFMTNRKSYVANEFEYDNHDLSKLHQQLLRKTSDMFEEDIAELSHKIVNQLNNQQGKPNSPDRLFEGPNATLYGRFILPLIAEEITKFAVVKALRPDAKIKYSENGDIQYDYKQLKSTSLSTLGLVHASSPEEISQEVLSKIKHGIKKNISENDIKDIASAFHRRFENVDENSLKLSQLILENTQTGLDFRIDATKDIADINALRNNYDKFGEVWNDVVSFWADFVDVVRSENPNSYMIAEMTDVGQIFDSSGKDNFVSPDVAQARFLQKTGMTTLVNYSHFFGLIDVFGKNFESGKSLIEKNDYSKKFSRVYNTLSGYLSSAPLESLIYSYAFYGNHDKPRVLHCLALDMDVFNSNLMNPKNTNARKIAISVIENKLYTEISDSEVANYDFSRVSNKAVAMGNLMRSGFGRANYELFGSDPEKSQKVFTAICNSVADMANGEYLNDSFPPDSFGARPLDVVVDMVLKHAEAKYDLELSSSDKSKLYNKAFEYTIKPAMSKLEGAMKFLVALPCNPTLYSGDNLGLTGFDEKAKNVYNQNRNVLHWEWLDESNKTFVKEFYNKINDVMALRSKSELQPLNDGTPFLLAKQHKISTSGVQDDSTYLTALMRQSPNGAMTISLFNPTGTDDDVEKSLQPSTIKIDSVSLHTEDGKGLSTGLTQGTIFRNQDKSDSNIYVVCEKNGNYFIKKFSSEDEYRNIEKSGMTNFSDNNRIVVSDSVMHLYHQPANAKPSFLGKKAFFNQQYNFVSSPYAKENKVTLGQKLLLN